MENQEFKIGIKTVWFLLIGNILLGVIGIVAEMQDWLFAQPIMTIALMLSFSSWVIIFNDIIKNKVYNKTFWIITMFIMPVISMVFYMIQRNKLLRLGQKFS